MHFPTKAKSPELFYIWVTKLQAHRLFKKKETAFVHNSLLQTLPPTTSAQRNGDLVMINQQNEMKHNMMSPSVSYSSCVFMLAELRRDGRFSWRVWGHSAVSQHRGEHQGVSLAEAKPRSRYLCSRFVQQSFSKHK